MELDSLGGGVFLEFYVCSSRGLWAVSLIGIGGGGGGFFLPCEYFGRMFDHSFPACDFFFFFLKWRLACASLIILFRPRSVHSGSAS